MSNDKKTDPQPPRLVPVSLLAEHRHGALLRPAGSVLELRPDQAERLIARKKAERV